MALELPEALWFVVHHVEDGTVEAMFNRHGLGPETVMFTEVAEIIDRLVAPYAAHSDVRPRVARSLYLSGLVAGLDVAHLMRWDPDPGELES